MSVSTIRAILLLSCFTTIAFADLPSCVRAKCVHCAVDFISRMCPTACSGCSSNQSPALPQTPQAYANPQQFSNSLNSRQVSNEGGAWNQNQVAQQPAQPQLNQQPQVQQQQTQQLPQIPQYSQPQQQPVQNPPQPQYPQQQQAQQAPQLPQQPQYPPQQAQQNAQVPQTPQYPQQAAGQQQQPFGQLPQLPQLNIPVPQQSVQFAAPTYQNAAPIPQQVVQTATLAPLVEPPKVNTFDPSLASRPADLAQPVSDYSASQTVQQLPAFNQPQPSTYGNQAANVFQSPQAASQNPFQMPNLFGTPEQQQSALLNPLQAFLQTGRGSPSGNPLDPWNLFGLGNQQPTQPSHPNPAPAQTQPSQYGQVQHQGSYNVNSETPASVQQQQYQQQYQQWQQQYQQWQQSQGRSAQQYNQPQYQNQGTAQGQTQQQVQQPQPAAQTSNPANQGTQANQLPQTNQQPQQLPTRPQQLPQQPQTSNNVDTRPVNFEKYVDSGKGTPLTNAGGAGAAAQQCPRQPGWQPCITKQAANDRFKHCCRHLGEGCAPLCEYDATLATMQLAVLTGRCPLSRVGEVMVCASGYQDASQCCEAYGVFEPGYEHCRPYCNPAAGLPEGGLLSEKYKCLVKLQHIQQCFFVSQKP